LTQTITTTDALAAFCARAADAPYVTVDTEFLRERTYYAQLCLVQMALPGTAEADAVLIDPLANGLSLDPVYTTFSAPRGWSRCSTPRGRTSRFSTSRATWCPRRCSTRRWPPWSAASANRSGYETLVRRIANAPLDKSSRFTDWSRRPLSDAQKAYALADVTHLRQIYEHLQERLDKSGRSHWMEEELGALTDASSYIVDPEEAWQRLKLRNASPKVLAIARELAAFRERMAQERNIPRSRILKDDALMELVSTKPKSLEDLSKSRLLLREARKGAIAEGLVEAVRRGLETPQSDWPRLPKGRDRSALNPALADLLRVLLKAKSEEAGVASKLIASSSDLDDIASGERDGIWARGWRREVFGDAALQLLDGKIALAADGERVKTVPV
jgi:ribonuclease D